MRLAVIGIDGFDMTFDHRFLRDMPFVRKNIKAGWKEIECSTAPHSAPSWTTIFSGLSQEEHGVNGFCHFSEADENTPWAVERRKGDKPWRRKDMPFDFVWDTLSSLGYITMAQGILFQQPGYSYNMPEAPKGFYDGKYNSLEKAQQYIRNFSRTYCNRVGDVEPPPKGAVLNSEVHLYCCTIQLPDQVHHHFSQLPFKVHQETMRMVDSLAKEIAKDFGNYILVSDHGIPVQNAIVYEKWKMKIPSHRGKAFITGNVDGWRNINSTIEIASFILALYGDYNHESCNDNNKSHKEIS